METKRVRLGIRSLNSKSKTKLTYLLMSGTKKSYIKSFSNKRQANFLFAD